MDAQVGTTKVGLIGYGAIGAAIVERWRANLSELHLCVVLVNPGRVECTRRRAPAHLAVTDDLDAFLAEPLRIVIEAAGHAAVAAHGEAVLAAGCELHALSAGALADDALRARLEAAARNGGGRIVIPAGALAGFDGLLSLKAAGLRSVKYSSVKPVNAWRGTAADEAGRLDALREARVIFSGSAREAAHAFPKNANLAAAVALAGLGFDETQVELVADPSARENRGRIEAVSDLGALDVILTGAGFADNPRTSQITAFSVIAALQGRCARIGFS